MKTSLHLQGLSPTMTCCLDCLGCSERLQSCNWECHILTDWGCFPAREFHWESQATCLPASQCLFLGFCLLTLWDSYCHCYCLECLLRYLLESTLHWAQSMKYSDSAYDWDIHLLQALCLPCHWSHSTSILVSQHGQALICQSNWTTWLKVVCWLRELSIWESTWEHLWALSSRTTYQWSMTQWSNSAWCGRSHSVSGSVPSWATHCWELNDWQRLKCSPSSPSYSTCPSTSTKSQSHPRLVFLGHRSSYLIKGLLFSGSIPSYWHWISQSLLWQQREHMSHQ